MRLDKEALVQILSAYFNIGDSYTYELTRVKEAFEIGTMSLDDFQEWNNEQVNDLADYILNHFNKSISHGCWYDVGSLSCRCSNCGCKSPKEYKYCPHCGAYMEEK